MDWTLTYKLYVLAFLLFVYATLRFPEGKYFAVVPAGLACLAATLLL